jgi:flagellar motor switch protein FliN
MNTGENQAVARLDALADTKQVLDQWAESLAQVLESMTDSRPEIHWQSDSGTASEAAMAAGMGSQDAVLWWEQAFQLGPDAAVWVGAPQTLWEHAGTVTLKAAGLDTVDPGEARSTWFEILSQSLAAMARSIGALVGREVNTEPGVEQAPAPAVREWARVSVSLAGAPPGHLLVGFSAGLVAQLVPAVAEPAPTQSTVVQTTALPPPAPLKSRTMDLLLDVDLPVSISFGKAELPMKDVLKLTTGSIVELNRGVNDPVEVLVNHCLIARGEVVVVDGNYGVKIQEIASRQDRLRSIR